MDALIGVNHVFQDKSKKDLTYYQIYYIIIGMNQKKAKQIRKILNYDPNSSESTQKRVYSRAKKQYNKLSQGAKILFLQELSEIYQQSN